MGGSGEKCKVIGSWFPCHTALVVYSRCIYRRVIQEEDGGGYRCH